MQRSPKIRKRTSCPGEMPGCWRAVNEGLFSKSSTGSAVCQIDGPVPGAPEGVKALRAEAAPRSHG
ncbi:Hypothetical predicted protein [Xyrichtys novacula]|uniref:Uncharacterized protein n=1 Tax=Xyrichtys novacula TaxID=13765 RepID=A0AAV1GSH1_XYRNO|nr:Hypothetical predicted protein [Xyrichtys novacula]